MKGSLVLKDDATFDDILAEVDRIGNGFLALVDQDNKLVGVVADGDIRKAVLAKNYDLDSLINRNPVVAKKDTPHEVVRNQLKKIHRQQMPIVDDENRLVDIVILNEFNAETQPNWVVIMAGGLGSRLGELTRETPKPMLEVNGKPILEYIMRNFEEFGFRKFVLCVNYKAEIIENYFGDGSKFGYQVKYTYENKRLGTAGALSLLEDEFSEPLFVSNGDVITNLDFKDMLHFHEQHSSEATMVIKRFSQQVPYACVEFSGQNDLIFLKEKPMYNHYVNAGVYLLNASILKLVPKEEFYDMPTFFEKLVEHKNTVKVFKMDDYWLDIGRPTDYEKIKRDFE